jgi:hypothetical protein
MQSEPIATDVVSLNLDLEEVYRSVVFSWSSCFSTNKTDRHDITEIFLNVALTTIKQTNKFDYMNK